MLFRSTARSTALNSAQLEELRRQDARKALERECRALRRQFTLLDKHHSELRVDHELQCQRLDSLVLQSSALLTLITRPVKAGASVERQCTPMPSFNQNNTGLEEEQTIERAALLRRVGVRAREARQEDEDGGRRAAVQGGRRDEDGEAAARG